jgi:asparagine synthase (glutamine-hydrolysing)
MCGIAGIVTRDGKAPDAHLLDTMQRALGHRGPDGSGRHVAAGVGLVQTRLAIIDLSTGDQPLFGPGHSVLVANGEIYNYLELRREFAGENFATNSDCELPLYAYKRDGADFARDLRGMYAVALADAKKNVLLLARDPFGIKPLYYAETAAGLTFASEPEALLKAGVVARKMRASVAKEAVQLQFTTGRATIYEGIERVLPGETLTVQSGRIAGRRFRAALPEGAPVAMSEDEALKKLDAVLMDSVAVHQRSDVPYGLFLSGGIDSSSVLACMARLNEKPVIAFTAGFPGTAGRDEREHARRVAKARNAEHIEVPVKSDDFWTHLPAIAAAMDDPSADYATIPTYLLARQAKKSLKVVLCGEGGDEIFGGYGRYRSVMRSVWLGGRAMRGRGFLDGLGVLRDGTKWREGYAAAESRARGHGWNRLQAAQALDCADWLPNDLLTKLDRCLMAHGVEGRTPFLDPVVADFALRLPDKLKVEKGLGKYLLRRWLQTQLPEADPFSPKRGFTVPVVEWMAPRAAALAPLVAGNAGIREICHVDAVERLFRSLATSDNKHAGAACWQLLFFALWHRIHIEGRSASGDVFECLSR